MCHVYHDFQCNAPFLFSFCVYLALDKMFVRKVCFPLFFSFFSIGASLLQYNLVLEFFFYFFPLYLTLLSLLLPFDVCMLHELSLANLFIQFYPWLV